MSPEQDRAMARDMEARAQRLMTAHIRELKRTAKAVRQTTAKQVAP